MFFLELIIDRLRTARLVVRALALVKGLGPYAAIELVLPGGTLIALGLWLYSRHRRGLPLLPFKLRPAAVSAGEPARTLSEPARVRSEPARVRSEAVALRSDIAARPCSRAKVSRKPLFSRPAFEGLFSSLTTPCTHPPVASPASCQPCS